MHILSISEADFALILRTLRESLDDCEGAIEFEENAEDQQALRDEAERVRGVLARLVGQ